ncbi:Hypothetical protein PHPALM_14202 [Phytophthora palmivora]|uniref:Uncharacterized protein n=1 Tax=Phytophthora palmivora TaxID=4796 RepID=A0A2P4XVB9_9STRA|nr:Hypothetical protein PHPALM_14202 [Phytophthora palmivora]
MDAASEAVELEQKNLVPMLADAQAKTGTDDGGEVESHTAAPERGSGDVPDTEDAGVGGKGGAQETEMTVLLRVMAKRTDKLEKSNSKLEKTLAEKKNDLRVDTFMTPPQIRSPHACEWTRACTSTHSLHSLKITRYHFPACNTSTPSIKQEQCMEYLRFICLVRTTVDVNSKNMDRTGGVSVLKGILLAQVSCGFVSTEFVKVDLLGNYIAGTTERYYNSQVETEWQMPTLQYVMEKVLETFKINIKPAQAMQLFSAPKVANRT